MHNTSTESTSGDEKPWRKPLDPIRVARRRMELAQEGFVIAAWARKHGFNARTVEDVLSGDRPCLRGKMHDIAVLLGLKDGVVQGAPAGEAA